MAVQKVYDLGGGYPVLVDEVAGGLVQRVRIDDGAGAPITEFGDSGLRTFTASRPQIANNASTLLIAANASRKSGSYFQNNSAATVYGNYGAGATLNQGFKVLPGGVFIFNTTQAIYLIQNSGSPINIDVFEAT